MSTVNMLENILKICVVSCLITFAIGNKAPKIIASAFYGHPNELQIEPFVKVGQRLYHFSPNKETWFRASLICRSLGGFLPSFDTQEKITELSDYMIARYPNDRWWWLSGSDLDSEGIFYWYNTGERITFGDWSIGQPDNNGPEHCVHLWFKEGKYQMNDWHCDRKAYYICEAERPKTVVVSVF